MRVGLSIKLMGYVMAGVLITSAVIGVVRVQNERGPLSELIDKAGQSVANATASGAASLVAGYDYGNLEILAENVARQSNVIHVSISNSSGRVMSQAKGDEEGTYRRFMSPIIFEGRSVGNVAVDISTRGLENALSALYWRVFVEQLVFGLVLGLIVYFFTANGIVSPILKLTRAMEEAGKKGDSFLVPDLEVKSRDEIGRLVAVFNSLNRALADYHNRLQGRIDFANRELLEKNAELNRRTQELEHALDRISAMATTDCLTELPNRRKFEETLSLMFDQSQRSSEVVSLVLFDIDFFKQINDSHGHGAGDQVLRDIASLLQRHVRKTDVPARLGGDEFGIVLYRTNTEQAKRFVEIFRNDLSSHVFTHDGVRLDVGISIGIAEYDASMKSPLELCHAADQALYHSKREGRGRVSIYAEGVRPKGAG